MSFSEGFCSPRRGEPGGVVNQRVRLSHSHHRLRPLSLIRHASPPFPAGPPALRSLTNQRRRRRKAWYDEEEVEAAVKYPSPMRWMRNGAAGAGEEEGKGVEEEGEQKVRPYGGGGGQEAERKRPRLPYPRSSLAFSLAFSLPYFITLKGETLAPSSFWRVVA